MLVTTTNSIEGKEIDEYLGVVSGEVITGINFIKDFSAGIRDFIGGRSKSYEDEVIQARKEAIKEIQDRASQINADAVIGCKLDYEVIGQSMLMVTISGTAVIFK